MVIPTFEQVKPFLPGTFSDINLRFSDISSRGLRNQLNLWVDEGKLFRFPFRNGKQGTPAIVYSLDPPPLLSFNTELLKIQYYLAEGIEKRDRKHLISAYQLLGEILINVNPSEFDNNDYPR